VVKGFLRALCLAFALALIPCAALAAGRVVDDAVLFSSSAIREMETIISRIQEQYQMDVVVLTSYEPGYKDSQDFADLYYENHGYGMGEDDAGMLYLIDMRNRVPCISTTGTMADYITDSRLEELFDCSYDALAAGLYGDSTITLLERLEKFLSEGREEGSFRYDVETGRRLTGVYNKLTGSEALVALVAGLLVAGVMYYAVSSRYNLRGSTYRYDAASNTQCSMTKDEEAFLRQHVSRVRHPQPDHQSGGGHGGFGGGSGMHTSSSGGSHGGGVGRGF